MMGFLLIFLECATLVLGTGLCFEQKLSKKGQHFQSWFFQLKSLFQKYTLQNRLGIMQ